MMIRKASTTIIAALALTFTGLVHAGTGASTSIGVDNAPVFNPWDLFNDQTDGSGLNQQASGKKETRFAATKQETRFAATKQETQFAATKQETQFAATKQQTQFAAAKQETQFARIDSLQPTLCNNDAWNCFNQESVDDSTNCSTDAWSCFSVFASVAPGLEE